MGLILQLTVGSVQPFNLSIGKYVPMAIGDLSTTKDIKATKTRKALNVSIAGKTIVFIKFFALYSFRAYPR